MRITDSLLALERAIEQRLPSVEKSLLGFFVLLGASEVPENWEPELQKISVQQEWQPPHGDPH